MSSYLANLLSYLESLRKVEQYYSSERHKTEEAIQEYLQSHSEQATQDPLEGLKRAGYERV